MDDSGFEMAHGCLIKTVPWTITFGSHVRFLVTFSDAIFCNAAMQDHQREDYQYHGHVFTTASMHGDYLKDMGQFLQ